MATEQGVTEGWKTGDGVVIRTETRSVEGCVILASNNSRSLMLKFDALLDGHLGMMPVLLEEGEYRSIMTGTLVRLTACQPSEISSPASMDRPIDT